MGSTATLRAAGVILGIAFVGLGANVYYRAIVSPEARSDFLVFHEAGRAVLDGRSPYEVAHPRGWPFFYPPTMAVLMAPLALLPAGAAVIAWYLLSVAALYWSWRRIVQVLSRDGSTALLVLAAFVCNGGPIVSCLQRGQISVILFALMTEAVWQGLRRRDLAAGFWIAAAASLKVYPALLLLAAVVRGRWRILAGSAAGMLVVAGLLPLVATGPARTAELTHAWIGGVLSPAAMGDDVARRSERSTIHALSSSNQSLYGVAGRWLSRSAIRGSDPVIAVLDVPLEAVAAMVRVASVVLLAVLAWLMWRVPGLPAGGGDRCITGGSAAGANEAYRDAAWWWAALWSAPMVAANLVLEIAWHHYYVVLALPYAAIGCALLRRPAGNWRSMLAAVAILAVLSNWLHFASYHCRAAGVMAAGSLVLVLVLLAAARVESRVSVPAPLRSRR